MKTQSTLGCFGRCLFFLIACFFFGGTFCHAEEIPALDSYGGYLSVKGEKTGFFHLEEIDGRQWLITPEGHGMFGMSMSHPLTSESSMSCQNIYNGDQRAWISAVLRQMRDLGYNCMLSPPATPDRISHGGVDSEIAHQVMLEERFPHTIGLILAKHPVEMEEGERWPDIFSKEYIDHVWAEAKKITAKYVDEPLVIGYFYGYGTFNDPVGWINDILRLEASAAGRIRLSAILKHRYAGRLSVFNEVYKTDFKSLSEISTGKLPEYPRSMSGHWLRKYASDAEQAMADDFGALIVEMARHLHELAYRALRAYDRNHLIIGGSVKERDFSDEMWAAIAPFLDAISPQHITRTVDINKQAKAIGKPLLVSDLNNGLVPNNVVVPAPFNKKAFLVTLEERIEMYKWHLKRIAHDADMIGANFCFTMYDQEAEHWRHRCEIGFYSLDGVPKKGYIDAVKNANTQAFSMVMNPVRDEAKGKMHSEFLKFYESLRLRGGLQGK